MDYVWHWLTRTMTWEGFIPAVSEWINSIYQMIPVWTGRSSHIATARITDYSLGVCIIRTRDIKSTSISVKLSLFECFILLLNLSTVYFIYIFNLLIFYLFLFCSTTGRISLFLNDRLLVVNNCSREQSSLRKLALLLLWYQNWCASCPWSTSFDSHWGLCVEC